VHPILCVRFHLLTLCTTGSACRAHDSCKRCNRDEQCGWCLSGGGTCIEAMGGECRNWAMGCGVRQPPAPTLMPTPSVEEFKAQDKKEKSNAFTNRVQTGGKSGSCSDCVGPSGPCRRIMMGTLVVCTEYLAGQAGLCPSRFTPCVAGKRKKNLSYQRHVMVCKINVRARPNKLMGHRNGVLNYEVHPKLPDGLTLNRRTGLISGTPLLSAKPTRYSVVAHSHGGQSTGSLQIVVEDPTKMGSVVPKFDVCKGCLGELTAPSSSSKSSQCIDGHLDTYTLSGLL
jgi:hypothetical protein